MGINQLIITIAFVLFPGVLATVICDKLTVHSKWDHFKFLLYSFLLGVITYSILQIITYGINILSYDPQKSIAWTNLAIWNYATTQNPTLPVREIVLGAFLSIPVAFLSSLTINYKLINKIGRWLKLTTKYGEENLFYYYLNSKEIDWVYIRDIQNNLTYQGRIISYSENEKMQEIVLGDVTVFSYHESEQYYSVPTIYLSKPIGNLIIEAIPKELLGAQNGEKAA